MEFDLMKFTAALAGELTKTAQNVMSPELQARRAREREARAGQYEEPMMSRDVPTMSRPGDTLPPSGSAPQLESPSPAAPASSPWNLAQAPGMSSSEWTSFLDQVPGAGLLSADEAKALVYGLQSGRGQTSEGANDIDRFTTAIVRNLRNNPESLRALQDAGLTSEKWEELSRSEQFGQDTGEWGGIMRNVWSETQSDVAERQRLYPSAPGGTPSASTTASPTPASTTPTPATPATPAATVPAATLADAPVRRQSRQTSAPGDLRSLRDRGPLKDMRQPTPIPTSSSFAAATSAPRNITFGPGVTPLPIAAGQAELQGGAKGAPGAEPTSYAKARSAGETGQAAAVQPPIGAQAGAPPGRAQIPTLPVVPSPPVSGRLGMVNQASFDPFNPELATARASRLHRDFLKEGILGTLMVPLIGKEAASQPHAKMLAMRAFQETMGDLSDLIANNRSEYLAKEAAASATGIETMEQKIAQASFIGRLVAKDLFIRTLNQVDRHLPVLVGS